MSATEISDLLPVAAGTKNPHPYQVFGLTGGEQDSQVIVVAIKKTIQKLQNAKADADPAVWKRAAKWVQQSREILLDPAKKKALDARFGVIDFADTGSPPSVGSPVAAPAAVPPPPGASSNPDPLAGLLPKTDPLAAVLPPGNPLAPQTPAVPPAPVAAVPGSPMAAAETPAAAAPQIPTFADPSGPASAAAPIAIKKKKPAKRRRKSIAGWFVFIGCAAAILAMLGALVWVVMAKPGTIAITAKDGSFTLSTTPAGAGGQSTSPSGQRVTSRPADPIMGSLGPNRGNDEDRRAENDSRRAPLNEGLNPDDWPSDTEQGPDSMQPATMQPEPAQPTPSQPDPMTTEPAEAGPAEMTDSDSSSDPAAAPSSPSTDDAPAMTPPSDTISEAMIAEAETLITKARTAIKTADWNQLRAVHDAAAETPLSSEQKPRAEPLFETADLATYYRGAIQRGVATLQTGSDFELTEALRVIVVEKGPDRLVIRFNATIKEYTFDELPPRLADKLASFALNPGDPTAIAAQAVYQAIAPKSTDLHRQDAIKTLENFTGEVEGANPKRIAAALRDVLKP
ncbi:hypothetical protein [Novipirellula caenicola]|uniref:Uncharacterized protein n=1 Tax=Novipirellula caenicola TaxID=1536901 RepID=A0ABP9VYD1_9BACT